MYNCIYCVLVHYETGYLILLVVRNFRYGSIHIVRTHLGGGWILEISCMYGVLNGEAELKICLFCIHILWTSPVCIFVSGIAFDIQKLFILAFHKQTFLHSYSLMPFAFFSLAIESYNDLIMFCL